MIISDIEELLSYKIQKSNDLVLSSMFDYSATEMDMSNFITMLIKKPEIDENGNPIFNLIYDISFNKLCLLTATKRNNRTYEQYKESLKGLRDKSIILSLPDGRTTPLFFLKDWVYDSKTGCASVQVSEKMIPFIMNLKKDFLSYMPEYSLLLNGKYSKRIYEMLKAYTNREMGKKHLSNISCSRQFTYSVSVQDFRKRLRADNILPDFYDLKRRVLDKAKEEINKKTDIKMDYEAFKKGGHYTDINFYVRYKEPSEILSIKLSNRMLIESVANGS